MTWNEATKEGWDDYKGGLWSDRNPYSKGTEAYDGWKRGWQEAHEVAVVRVNGERDM